MGKLMLFFQTVQDLFCFKNYERSNPVIEIAFVNFVDNTLLIRVNDEELSERIRKNPSSYGASSVWCDES
jgi:hypothetical protein